MRSDDAAVDGLIETIRTKLYTAVVSDVLDHHGYLDQAMDARIRPIDPEMRVVGRAHTVLSADIYQRPENPYEMEIAAIDAVTPARIESAPRLGPTVLSS